MHEQHLTLILPPQIADLPVRIVRGNNDKELVCGMEQDAAPIPEEPLDKYIFVWNRSEYLKLPLNDILWFEASRSYCTIHLTEGKNIIISSPLAEVVRTLPAGDFIRIHRSYLVNMRHVTFLVGNSLRIGRQNLTIGRQNLTIGREYRKQVLDRFIFVGVKRKHE